jgi:hypothetical protein
VIADRTRREIDGWWRQLFDVGDALWSAVTVHPHGPELDGHDGWYVAWRGSGVHVSAPATAGGELASLRDRPTLALKDPAFWHAFARQRGLEVSGPVAHRRPGRPRPSWARFAVEVRRACAAHAMREHGVALWRAARSNVPSARTAERLGFEPYVTQLAVVPGGA